MWVERQPTIGETVKIEFAEWTRKGTKIGIYLRSSIEGKLIIDLGRTLMYLDRFGGFLVWENQYKRP